MDDGLPTIDLGPIVAGAAELAAAEASVARALDQALRSWGAFRLTGHGVPQASIDGAFTAACRFFAQPLPARLAIKVNRHNRGYVPMHQTVYAGNLPDLKESFNLGLPLPADDADVMVGKPLHGLNAWPELANFRADVEQYFNDMRTLGDRLLGPLALCLGLAPATLRDRYRKPIAFMRLFHYPPNSRVAEREHGAAEHQDYGFLTFLAQDDAGGLEIRAPDDSIVSVLPQPGSLIVNGGDMLTQITGGAFRSAPHRVINRAGIGRYSIPFFYDPDFDARFDGLPGSAGEFLMAKFDKFYTYRKSLAEAS